jgi:hypothetical protein
MNPSLLLIPDRYKAAKLYSQIPDSGAGDLTFARNSNATRVNSAGLIEKVRTNLLTYSEQFDNAAWNKLNTTIAANQAVSPDGTTNADLLYPTTTGGDRLIEQTVIAISGETWTSSFFVKASGFSWVLVYAPNLGVCWFNATTGQFGTVTAGVTARVLGQVNGFWRISFTGTLLSATSYFYAGTADANGSITSTTSGTNGLLIWGAQLELGDIATDYIPTTTAAVSVGITADIPRLDYTGGGCPSLLLEPQRTNRAQFSEQFDNAYWTKSGATILANAAVSPDGFQNADKLVEDAGVVQPSFFRLSIAGANVVHTNSIYAKAGERIWLVMNIGDGVNSARAWFNLSAGVIGTVNAGLTAQIQDAGNGWYRCIITRSVVAFASTVIEYQIATSDGVEGYTGNGTSGLFIYGVQFEAGSYVSSYIPTLGSSVTRLADAASKTSAAALIGQTEGTLFAEIQVIAGTINIGIWLRQSGSLYDNFMLFHINISSLSRAEIVNGGVQQVNITGGVVSPGFHKMAFAYKANDVAFYIDGVQIAVGTSATIPTCDEIYIDQYIDGSSRNATKKQAAIYPVRLSNSELASLTSL